MAPRRLMLKFYIWFLIALTLTVVSAGVVVALASWLGPASQGEDWALNRLRSGRDYAQAVLAMPLSHEQKLELVALVARENRVSVSVLLPDGSPLLEWRHPESSAAQSLQPEAEMRRLALEEGPQVDFRFRSEDRLVAALPIELPEGGRGVFYLRVGRNAWDDGHGHLNVMLGLAVVLVVGWLLCWPLARHLAAKLTELADVADRLGQGDMTARYTGQRGHRHKHRHPDEITRLGERFNAMADNLQRLLVSHKQLLADISHELRSPLARLRVALELAQEDGDARPLPHLLRAEAQVEVLDGMIGELLTFSRLEAAPTDLRLERVAPHEPVQLLAEECREEARARGVEILVDVPRQPLLEVDRTLVRRALGNVLRNALAYAPEGSTVRVEGTLLGSSVDGGTEAGAGRAERFRWCIIDQGPGVPGAMRDRIFEPFVRTDAARSRHTGGVGLGLAIARRCMQAHGGGVEAAPGPNGLGLNVRLWLPIRQRTGADA